MVNVVSPFMYQLDEFISNFRVVDVFFFSIFIHFYRTFCRPIVESLVKLVLHCLPMSLKKDALGSNMLNGLKDI